MTGSIYIFPHFLLPHWYRFFKARRKTARGRKEKKKVLIPFLPSFLLHLPLSKLLMASQSEKMVHLIWMIPSSSLFVSELYHYPLQNPPPYLHDDNADDYTGSWFFTTFSVRFYTPIRWRQRPWQTQDDYQHDHDEHQLTVMYLYTIQHKYYAQIFSHTHNTHCTRKIGIFWTCSIWAQLLEQHSYTTFLHLSSTTYHATTPPYCLFFFFSFFLRRSVSSIQSGCYYYFF